MAEGTGCMTTSKHVVLFWDQRRYRKSIPLDTKLNIGLARTASGYKRFATFMANVAHNWEHEMEEAVFETHIIPDDESTAPRQLDDDDMSFQPPDPVDPPTTTDPPIRQQGDDVPVTIDDLPTTSQVDFALPDKPHVIPDDEEPRNLTPHDELLRWHYRLGHVSFRRIQLMAKRNELPKKLLEAKIPLCPACQYGKTTRRPWRTKPQQTGKQVCTVTAPGQVVSVDQLESTTVGFIGQLKGILTTRRYKYATVFVDQYSRLSFVFLQRRLTSEETVLAKHAFERYARDRGVRIQHYHADNGRFADNGFIRDCQAHGQGLTYCGVNAHFQNGIAEKKIRDLQEQTRTMLLYAIGKWPRMLNIHLWPYALRTANAAINAIPTIKDQRSPEEIFSGVEVMPKIRHFHTFGCPTYVLDNNLQAQKGLHKWKVRSRLGIYLGPSPNHARSISLVLNPRTGHVSPQFHVKHDDFFETVTGKATDFDTPEPDRKYLSRLTVKKKQRTHQQSTNMLPEKADILRPVRAPNQQHSLIPPMEDDIVPLPVDEPPLEPIHQPMPEPEGGQAEQPTLQRQTRSGRVVRNTQRYAEGVQQRQQGLVAWETLVDQDDNELVPTAQQQYEIQQQLEDPLQPVLTLTPCTSMRP